MPSMNAKPGERWLADLGLSSQNQTGHHHPPSRPESFPCASHLMFRSLPNTVAVDMKSTRPAAEPERSLAWPMGFLP